MLTLRFPSTASPTSPTEVSRVSDAALAVTEVRFDPDDEWQRIERAVDEADYESPAEFVREGALRLVDEVLDEDGRLECPHDDCDRTFPTRRKLRGHLGSSDHALDIPEGDFWCGYCGYGPNSWRGINAHHGSSDHDGDLVRLDEEPSREDLIAPGDVPDHKNPDLLKELYRRHDGNYSEMCRQHDFEVSPGRVRHYLIEFGIHEVTPQGEAEDGDGPRYRDREWLQERYNDADGNISEMHRNLEIDVPYRTLVKNIKRFDFHDPTDPPGKRHGKGGPKPSTEAEPDPKPDDQDDDEDQDDGTKQLEGLDHTDPEDLQAAFDEYDTISDAAEAFPEVTYATVRQRMIEHGIYTPESYDTGQDDATEADETETAEADDVGADRVDEDIQDEPVAEPEPEPDDPQAQLGVDDPAAVESFHNLDTPDWLDEASFYQAVDMADNVEKLGEVLGWEEYDRLKRMVELLGVDERLDECLADRRNMEA